MSFDILHRYTKALLYRAENATTVREAVVAARQSGADLREADLRGANLRGADLWGANLRGADLWGADLRGANLRGANLWGANLRGADLRGADLREADLREADLREADLDTGENWETYINEVVPALLTAGGKDLGEAGEHWNCHIWEGEIGCPMAWAFDAESVDEIPVLFRPRAKQFIQLFDAELIPCPTPSVDPSK